MDKLDLNVSAQSNEEGFTMLNATSMNMNDSFLVTETVHGLTPATPVVNVAPAFDPMNSFSFGSNLSAPINSGNSYGPRAATPPGFTINGTFPVRNQPVSGSRSATIYGNGLSADRLPRNQQPRVVSSTNKRPFSAINLAPCEIPPFHARSSFISSMLQPNIYFPVRNQPTPICNEPDTFQLQGNDIARNLVYDPTVGGISVVRSDVSFSLGNQQNTSGFGRSPFFGSSGPPNYAMNYCTFSSETNFWSVGEIPQHLLPNWFPGQIPQSICPNKYGTLTTCIECRNEFPSFHALGGHISSQAMAHVNLAKRVRAMHVCENASSVVVSDYGESFSVETNALLMRSAATYQRLEAFFTTYMATKNGNASSSVVETGVVDDAGSSTSSN